jgi:hypothetical protein
MLHIPETAKKKQRCFTESPPFCFKSSLLGYINPYFISKKNHTVQLFNEKSYIILPNTCCTIGFNVVVITSLPAICILRCDELFYKTGLSYNINIIQANDNFLHITIYNYSKNSITLKEGQLNVICDIVSLGKPYIFS